VSLVFSFSLDGIRSEDKGIYINNVTRDILPPITSRTISIPDKHGAYYYKHKYGVRRIEIAISIISSTFNSNQDMVRTIAEYLDPLKDERKLIFDDENDRYYMAVITEDTNVSQIIKLKRGTIRFLIVYPFARSTTDELIKFIKKADTVFVRASTAYDYKTLKTTNAPRFTDGLHIEQGTTNLIGVSNFETGVDSWFDTADGTTSSAQSNYAYIGNRSLRATWVPGGSVLRDYVSTFTAGDKYVFSAWIFVPDHVVGKTLRVGVEQRGGVNANVFNYYSLVLVAGWQFIDPLITIDYSDRDTMRMRINAYSGFDYGDQIWIDVPQFEKSDYATTYTDGTRAYESAYVTKASSGINFHTGTIEFYLNKITKPEAAGGIMEIGAYSSPVTLDRFVILNGTGLTNGEKQFSFQVNNGSTAESNTVSATLTNTPVKGQNYYVCIRWKLTDYIKIDVYDYTNTEHIIASSTISMTAPGMASYTNVYFGLLTSTDNSNWRFRAIMLSEGAKSDSDILDAIANGADQFISDSRTEYHLNLVSNQTLDNISFTRVGTAPATPVIKVRFSGSVSEYKIIQTQSNKYIRVVNSFVSGDILLIDGNNNKIYINDVLHMDKLDLNSQFFVLEYDENIFTINQYSSTETMISYSPTWL
jgi:predicted phage tail component-like protein